MPQPTRSQPQPPQAPPSLRDVADGAVAAGAPAAGLAVGGARAAQGIGAGYVAGAVTGAVGYAAVAQATKAIVEALMRFFKAKSTTDFAFLAAALLATRPAGVSDEVLKQVRDEEAKLEREFQKKALARARATLPKLLATEDPAERANKVQAFLDREQSYVVARQKAMVERADARVERALLKQLSPQGAYWALSPHVSQHTLDCLVMGGKFWPWEVLDQPGFAPPLHHGCPCQLYGLDEAIAAGLMTAKDVPETREAVARAKREMDRARKLMESIDLDTYRAWAYLRDGRLEEAELDPPPGSVALALDHVLAEAQTWDDRLHPRDRLGRWVQKLARLRVGQSMRTEFGRVERSREGYHFEQGHPTDFTRPQRHFYSRLRDAAEHLAREPAVAAGPAVVTVDGISADQVGEALDGFRYAGLVLRTSKKRAYPPAGGEVHFDVVDRAGNVAGFVSHKWQGDTVELDRVKLDPDKQDTGFATALTSHTFDAWKLLGFRRVRVHAVQVGGYAWAKWGFQFERSPRVAVDSIANDAMQSGRWNEMRDHVSEDVLDEFASLLMGGHFKSEADLASWGRDYAWTENGHAMWPGKKVMMNARWHGMLDLGDVPAQAAPRYQHKDDPESFWERMEMLGHERPAHLREALNFDVTPVTVHFDPHVHPRDRLGKFIETLGKLPKPKALGRGHVGVVDVKHSPFKVGRTKKGYLVAHQGTGTVHEFATAEEAAKKVHGELQAEEERGKAQAELAASQRERGRAKAEREAESAAARSEEAARLDKEFPRDEKGRRYYHRLEASRADAQAIVDSGELWGRPRRNIYASDRPAAKAHIGRLPDTVPEGFTGVEFVADTEPDEGHHPRAPEWSMLGDRKDKHLRLEDGIAKLKIHVTGHTL
jgi:hypothetical protein